MPFELKLAIKYFRARRKSLARFTSFVAVVGIAVGVASLIIAQSLAKGFQDEMRDKILANTAHISVSMKNGGEIHDWQMLQTKLVGIENVREILPTAYENALLITETETSYAIIKTQNSLVGSQIAIGKQFAERLNLNLTDSAEIATIENQTPSRVRVAEIFETGLYDYDTTQIGVSPEMFAKLQKQTFFTPTNLSISIRDIFKSAETAEKISAELGENFRVIGWQEANRPLFAALSLERKVVLVIILLIIFTAVLNITTTLALLVNERRLDIAILRTCGAKTRNLLTIFLLEGLFLGVLGIFCGVIFGLLVCFAGNYFKLVKISAEVYSLNYIPFRPDFFSILLIILITFTLCFTATVYPAWKASRLKPLENLQMQ
jgi:lipoprotein-releasing system permease protein